MNFPIKIYFLLLSLFFYTTQAFASDTVIVGQSVSNCNNNSVCETEQGEATSNCSADCPASSSAVLPGAGSFPIQTVVPVTKVDITPSTEEKPIVSEKISIPTTAPVIIPEVKIVEIKKEIIPVIVPVKTPEISETIVPSVSKKPEITVRPKSPVNIVEESIKKSSSAIRKMNLAVKRETNFIKVGARDISVRVNKNLNFAIEKTIKIVKRSFALWEKFWVYLGL